MAPQLTDADIAKHDAAPHPGVLTDADIAQRDSHPEGYLSQVGSGLWNTVKGLYKVGSEAGAAAVDPLNAVEHLKNLKQMLLDPQVDQAITAAQKWKSGDHSEAVGHALAAVIPGVGPAAANIGEKLGSGDLKGAAADATVLGATMAAPHVAGAVADLAPRAVGAVKSVGTGLKAAGPDIGSGLGKIVAGEALAKLPGMELPARIGLGYPGAKQIGKGITKGIDAAKAARATPVVAEPEVITPGQALAQESGTDWAKLSAQDKAMMETVARAQSNAAAQPVARPPAAPTEVVSRETGAPPAGPQTIQEMLQAEIAARQAAQPPEPIPASPPIGAHRVVPPVNGRGVPLQPPLRPPAPAVAPSEAVPPVAPQPSPAIQEPMVQPPTPPAVNPSAVSASRNPAELAKAAGLPPDATPKQIAQAIYDSVNDKGRTLPQTEAAMVQKKPAPIDISEARTSFNAEGTTKSPQKRGADRMAYNVDAKSLRQSEALHAEGITVEDINNMTAGDMQKIIDGLKAKGILPDTDTAPNSSMPALIDKLKKLEKSNAAKPAAKSPSPSAEGPMSNPKKLRAQEIARQLAEEIRQ